MRKKFGGLEQPILWGDPRIPRETKICLEKFAEFLKTPHAVHLQRFYGVPIADLYKGFAAAWWNGREFHGYRRHEKGKDSEIYGGNLKSS